MRADLAKRHPLVNQGAGLLALLRRELAAIDLGGRAGYRNTESDLERSINERRKTADC